jgi:hypothetical protein
MTDRDLERPRWVAGLTVRVWVIAVDVLLASLGFALSPSAMITRRSALVSLMSLLAAPLAAEAQQAAENPFRFELEEAQSPFRGRAVEGYVYNNLPWRITNVRLRVENVDPTGVVTGESYGWVVGDVKAGGRGYFFVLVSSRAATYRATVESFNKVALEAPTEAP